MDREYNSVSLSEAPLQKTLRVVKITGEEDFCSKIAEAGIFPGTTIKIRWIGAHCLVRTIKKRFVKVTDKLTACITVTY